MPYAKRNEKNSMNFTQYEKIIIRDVKNKNYDRDKRVLQITFVAVTAIFALIYYFCFHENILATIKFILEAYKESMFSLSWDYKMLVYNFNKIIVFTIFLFFFIIFCLLMFLSYDMLSRNRVIKYYQENTTPGSDGTSKDKQ